MCYFDDKSLAHILTVSEVSYLWNKSETAIMHHVYKNTFRARLTLTGGTWLVKTASVVKHWGMPTVDNIFNYYETDTAHANQSGTDTALR